MNKERHPTTSKGSKTNLNRSVRTFDPSPASISNPDFDDEEEEEEDFLRDVWWPSGAALRFIEMEMAFRSAGYAVRKSELSPHSPPVAVLRLARRTAPRYSDHARFVQHVRQILESVGIHTPKADLLAEQDGNMVLVSLLWQPLTPDSSDAEGPDGLPALLP